MRVLFIYNQHNAREVAIKDKLTNEMLCLLDNVGVFEMEKAKEFLKIRTTPALIFIREDLQGECLIEQDEQLNKLKAICEIGKAMQEEDLFFRKEKTNRIEEIVRSEIVKGMGENMQIMTDMFEMLNESGVL